MKQYLKILIHKIAQLLEEGLLGIICLHKMGIPPIETVHLLHIIHPGQEEVRMLASITYLKQEGNGSWN